MRLKAATSILLVMTVTAFFSVRSLAAFDLSDDSKPVSEDRPASAKPPSGTLTATGQVRVNDNESSTGATILDGSRVATGPDGDAVIDLGPLGRVQLRPDTEVKLIFGPNTCQLEIIRCGSITQTVPAGVSAQARKMEPGLMEVAVLPGEALVTSVKSNDTVTVTTGENRVFHEFESLEVKGDTIFTLNCCDCELPAAGFIFPFGAWWGGVVALSAAAVPVGVGVDTGDEDPPASPVVP